MKSVVKYRAANMRLDLSCGHSVFTDLPLDPSVPLEAEVIDGQSVDCVYCKEIAQANQERMEKDCRAMCETCALGVPVYKSITYYHRLNGLPSSCAASAIREL